MLYPIRLQPVKINDFLHQPMNVTKQTSLNFQIDLKQIYDLLLDLSLYQQIVEKKKLFSYLLYLFYIVTRYTNNSIGTQKYCLKDSPGLSCTFQNYFTHADVRLCNCDNYFIFCPMLRLSLACPFLIAPSDFSHVYLHTEIKEFLIRSV